MNTHLSPLYKIICSAALLVSVFTFRSNAQAITELNGWAGYTLAESFYNENGGKTYLKDGPTYGGALAIYPHETFDIILSYWRQETTVDYYDYYYVGNDFSADASVNYVMIGAERNAPVGGNAKSFLFGGFDMGAAGLEPKDSQYSGRWKFALDLHAGAKIYPSPNIGIRLQAGINFPIQYFGAAFTVGTGGSGAGVSAGSSITQVCFLGGLMIRINKK